MNAMYIMSTYEMQSNKILLYAEENRESEIVFF